MPSKISISSPMRFDSISFALFVFNSSSRADFFFFVGGGGVVLSRRTCLIFRKIFENYLRPFSVAEQQQQ